MANYYEHARSNYFQVKDRAAFEKFLDQFDVRLIEDVDGGVGFITEGEDGLPHYYLPEGAEEHVEIDFLTEAAKHLADDAVMIVMGTGYEKMRYLIGYAIAINSRGETREVRLDQVYDMAKELTQKPEAVTFAEY